MSGDRVVAQLCGMARFDEERAPRTQELQMFVVGLVAQYATCDAATRTSMRKAFERHPSFAWLASLPFDHADTIEHFRAHVLLFSLGDQGRDARDAMLHIDALCAKSAHLPITGVLREVAALSNAHDRFRMAFTSSTASLLLRLAR